MNVKYRNLNFFLAISYFPSIWKEFSKIMSPPSTLFQHFPEDLSALYNAIFVLGTLQIKALKMSSTSRGKCLCLSIYYLQKVRVLFSVANLCFLSSHISSSSNSEKIQTIFMLTNKCFIAYCTALIRIINVQDIQEQ